MTSKEFIQNEIKNLEEIHKTAKDLKSELMIKNSEEEIEQYNQVLKDLEMLEIIKKWSFLDTFYREDTNTTYDRFLCNIHTRGMKEDFEKIKEWLDNDK